MKKILFVCVENSNRSQMADALARIHGGGLVQAASAGSKPAERVNPKAVAAMVERGYDLSNHRPKSFEEVEFGPWDYVVTMGCGETCPVVSTHRQITWDLPDPKGMATEEYHKLRDEIEGRVLKLLAEIGRGESG